MRLFKLCAARISSSFFSFMYEGKGLVGDADVAGIERLPFVAAVFFLDDADGAGSC